jgi:ATP synthase F0 subunit b
MSAQANGVPGEALTTEAPREEVGLLGQLGLNTHLFTAQLLNFAVVLFVVVRFVVRPLQAQLAERSARIEQGLRQAKEAEERLQAAVSEQGAVLAQAKREAASVIEAARAAAQAEQDAYVERTKAEVNRLVASGKAQLAHDRDLALQEAKAQLAAVVLAAAGHVAEGALNPSAAQAQAVAAVEKAYAKA